MARLIHLDGAPGVGKSTLAQRYAEAHPGTLCCDIDVLRVLVGGWREDFAAAGAIIRPVALAMVRAHLDGGHDVVLPQMLASTTERARFASAARDGGHDYLRILLRTSPGTAVARFYARPLDAPAPAVIREVVDGAGGPEAIRELVRRLDASVADADVVIDAGPDVEAVYRSLVDAVGPDPGAP